MCLSVWNISISEKVEQHHSPKYYHPAECCRASRLGPPTHGSLCFRSTLPLDRVLSLSSERANVTPRPPPRLPPRGATRARSSVARAVRISCRSAVVPPPLALPRTPCICWSSSSCFLSSSSCAFLPSLVLLQGARALAAAGELAAATSRRCSFSSALVKLVARRSAGGIAT